MWTITISYKDQLLYGRRGRVAEAAARDHFQQAGCTPHQAAEAAWQQEGADMDPSRGLTEQQEQWAEVWRRAPEAVASALGASEEDIDVELHREPGR